MAAVHLKDLIKAQQQQEAAKNQNQERMSMAEFKKLMGLTSENTKKTTEVLGKIETLSVQSNSAQQEQVEKTSALLEKDEGTHTRLDDIKATLDKTLKEAKNQTQTLEKIDKASETPKATMEQDVEGERVRDETLKTLKDISGKLSGKGEKKDTKQEPGSLGGILAAAAVALGAIVGSISGYAKAIIRINKALFGAFEAAVAFLGNKWPKIFGGLQKLLFNIEATFVIGLEMVKDKFAVIIEKAMGVINVIRDFFSSVISKLMNSKVVKYILEVVESITGVFKGFFGSIGKEIKVIESVASPLVDIIKSIRNGFGKFFGFFEEMFAFIKGTGKTFSAFSTIFGAVSKIVSKLMLPLTIIMTVWDVVKGAMEGYEKEGVIGMISGAIKGLISSIVTAPLDLLKGLASWILDIFGFDKASKFLDSFSFDDIMKGFIDAIFHPIDTIKSIFTKVMDFFENFEIPEIGFTIPVINKKVSIGPFHPFKKEDSGKGAAPSAGASAASPAKAEGKASELGAKPALTEAGKAQAATPAQTAANEGRAPGDTRVAKTAEKDKTSVMVTVAGEPVQPGKPLTDKQVAVVESQMRLGNEPSPEVKKAYDLAKSGAKATGAGPADTSTAQAPAPTEASAVYNKSADNAQASVNNQGGSSAPVVVNAPVTTNVKSDQNISMSAPVRNQDRGFNRYMQKNSVFI